MWRGRTHAQDLLTDQRCTRERTQGPASGAGSGG